MNFSIDFPKCFHHIWPNLDLAKLGLARYLTASNHAEMTTNGAEHKLPWLIRVSISFSGVGLART